MRGDQPLGVRGKKSPSKELTSRRPARFLSILASLHSCHPVCRVTPAISVIHTLIVLYPSHGLTFKHQHDYHQGEQSLSEAKEVAKSRLAAKASPSQWEVPIYFASLCTEIICKNERILEVTYQLPPSLNSPFPRAADCNMRVRLFATCSSPPTPPNVYKRSVTD